MQVFCPFKTAIALDRIKGRRSNLLDEGNSALLHTRQLTSFVRLQITAQSFHGIAALINILCLVALAGTH
jgi:hypothetical protein